MVPFENPLRTREPNQIRDLIPALDGVRGFAVLLVLLDHASDSGLTIFPGADFDRAGKYGVYLFFVLSAFLLTYPFFLRDPADILKPRVWANYWVRRFLRIAPLYVLVLSVHHWKRHSFTWSDYWNHLLLRQGDGHFWTIPVEFKYYFVLPFFVLAIGWVWRVKGWHWGFGAAALFYGVFLKLIVFPLEAAWSLSDNVLLEGTIHAFLLGSLAGVLHAWLVRSKVELSRVRPAAEAIAFLSIATVIVLIPGIYNALLNPGKDVKSIDDMGETCTILWPLFILGLVHGTGWLRRVFEWSGLRWLGMISYSAYLWHRMILGEMDNENPIPQWLQLLMFIAVVVLAASISYWIVERPLSRIRLTRRRDVILPNAEASA